MKPLDATFHFNDRQHGPVTVRFLYDSGKPTEAIVTVGGADIGFDNTKGHYKACITHCHNLLRHATYKPPADNFEQQRRVKTRPMCSGSQERSMPNLTPGLMVRVPCKKRSLRFCKARIVAVLGRFVEVKPVGHRRTEVVEARVCRVWKSRNVVR